MKIESMQIRYKNGIVYEFDDKVKNVVIQYEDGVVNRGNLAIFGDDSDRFITNEG